jgi:hypothetical protein
MIFPGLFMEKPDAVVDLTERAFRRACLTYDGLAEAIAESIRRLVDRPGGEVALSKTETDTLRAHQKSLIMVLDLEADILRRRHADAAGADAPLDLERARQEVARRLDRIAAARGS